MENFSQKQLDYINQNPTEYSSKIYMSVNRYENPAEFSVVVRAGGVYELGFKDIKTAMRFAQCVSWSELANGKVEVDGTEVTITMKESKSAYSYFCIECGNNQQMAEKFVKELRTQRLSQNSAENILAK